MLVDLIVICVLLISAVVAFLRGFIREVLTIIGVLGGLLFAVLFYDNLSPLVQDLIGVDPEAEDPQRFMDIIPYPLLADFLSGFAIFIVVVILLSAISHYLSSGAQKLGLGMVDRTLGVIFGIARGLLLLALLYMPFMMFTEEGEQDNWFEDSRTVVYIEWTSEWIAGFLPESFTSEQTAAQVRGTRERLEDEGLLPENQAEDEEGDGDNAEEGQSEDEGYDGSQRRSLDQMIQDQN